MENDSASPSTMTSAPAELPAAGAIVALHDRLLATPGWPTEAPAAPSDLWHWVQTNHRNNSLLWAEEDLARRTTVAAAEIAANKRAIDGYNQARNDATERVDEILLVALGMVDRLSIMALKAHAMRAQTERQDVDEAHRAASRVKLERLQQQRQDLATCLDELLRDAAAGRAYFKVYRQFKMYNDARFNPELVKERKSS
jgi:Protein of unknown function (DUF4254)